MIYQLEIERCNVCSTLGKIILCAVFKSEVVIVFSSRTSAPTSASVGLHKDTNVNQPSFSYQASDSSRRCQSLEITIRT